MIDLHSCQLCARLVSFRLEQKQYYPDYHCRPVKPFGDDDAHLLIVGLAPGLHGANASGRPFTGDASGELLFKTLYQFGFANQAVSSHGDDETRLIDCRITNAVKCLPPQNKPNADEVNRCNAYLRDEIKHLPPTSIILALGSLAHRATLKALALPQTKHRFSHLAEHVLSPGLKLIDSYHCSRYNINTGRLTLPMFAAVFARIRLLIQ